MKQRIFLGLAPIFILFVGTGLYANWLFTRLGAALDVILRDNYQCVPASDRERDDRYARRKHRSAKYLRQGERVVF